MTPIFVSNRLSAQFMQFELNRFTKDWRFGNGNYAWFDVGTFKLYMHGQKPLKCWEWMYELDNIRRTTRDPYTIRYWVVTSSYNQPYKYNWLKCGEIAKIMGVEL